MIKKGQLRIVSKRIFSLNNYYYAVGNGQQDDGTKIRVKILFALQEHKSHRFLT